MESTREKLVKVFGCTVVSLYSNQEMGMLAQECALSSRISFGIAVLLFGIIEAEQ